MALAADREVGDSRVFRDTDYYIPREFVNEYTSDVQTRKPPPVNSHSHENNTLFDEPEGPTTTEGDPTDGEPGGQLSDCARNWKAAASDENKKMWSVFDESGLFASACRHGFILWIVDMVKSGEL